LETHDKLITDLGGPTALAREIEVELHLAAGAFSQRAIPNWRKRGVPPDMRQTVAAIALRKGVAVPAGFLLPCHRRRHAFEPKGAANDDGGSAPTFLTGGRE
jgi:hypothetical protein